MRTVVLLVAAVCCVADSRRVPGDGAPQAGEAQGKAGGGIAADYPGDAGIGADPRVIFADDFEGYASSEDLDRRWNARLPQRVDRDGTVRQTFTPARSRSRCLAPRQTVELSNGIAKILTPRGRHALPPATTRSSTAPSTSRDRATTVAGSQRTTSSTARATRRGTPADGTNKNSRSSSRTGAAMSRRHRPASRTSTFTTRRSESSYGDHFFFRTGGCCRTRAAPVTSGRRLWHGRTSRRCSAAGTATK